MNELGIFVQNDRVVVSSRDVARVFEKPHDKVLRDIRGLDCSNEFRLSNFGESFEEAQTGNGAKREFPIYLITRDGFTLLAMGYTGKKAMQFKEAYIAAFNRMEAELKNKYSSQIPGSFAEALELAASIEKERANLAARVEKDRPKVLFAETVETSKTSILVNELAKILKQNGVDVGQNRLFRLLREDGFLMKNGESRNMPTQRSMDLGLFEIKERTVNNPDGSIRITRTPKVTGKGQVYLVNKYREKFELEPIA